MTKRVYTLRPNEDWIVDRLVDEWNFYNSDMTTNEPKNADVVWLLANWCYRRIEPSLLKSKRVVTTIHHVVEDKFDISKRRDFEERDSFTDVYHVPNNHTESFVKKFTRKPVVVIPYWANQEIWKRTGDAAQFRLKYGLDVSKYTIGSWQRDTEGSDLKSPKLEKGPDLFLDFVKSMRDSKGRDNIHIVLAGWRRQYVMNGLNELGVTYDYFDRPSQAVVNELYQCVDLYPVTSRCEGGPQALIECGLLQIPVVSRNVGIASQVLPLESINDNVSKAVPHVPSVEHLKMPLGFEEYRKLFQNA